MPSQELKPSIRELPLFSELSVEELRRIMLHSAIRNYQRGEFIFIQGDEYRGFYVVLKGRIKVFKTNRDGKEQIVHLLGPREVFAETPLFTGGAYPVDAVALETTMLLCVGKTGFLDLLRGNSDLCLRMLGGFAKRLREMATRLEEISLKEVTPRLARYLLEEASRSPAHNTVELTISKATLAAFLGTIPETLSRSFRQLETSGAITVNGRLVTIHDGRMLRRFGSD
jgi:CRP/FNR family transcriptional regulator